MSTLPTAATVHQGSHSFIVKGFSFTKEIGAGKCLISDAFLVGGYKWVVTLYPNSKGTEGGDNSGYISAFVGLAIEATNVKAFFSIGVCDMSRNRKHMIICPWTTLSNTAPFTFNHRGSQWGYQRVCRRDVFEKSDYVKDDSLRIDCNIGVVLERTMSLPYSIHVPSSDIHDARFGLLLDNYKPSNLVFSVAGERFNAHHRVFTARCPKFDVEYLRGMRLRDEEIVVTDMYPKVFKAFLFYLYRDRLVDDEDLLASTSSSSTSLQDWVVAKLLAVADRYELSRLRLLCESFLLKHVKMDSFVEMHEMHSLAIRCNAHALRRICDKIHSDVCKIGTVPSPEPGNLLVGREEIPPYGPDNVWVHVPEGTTANSRCSIRLVLGPLSVDDTSHLLLVPGKRQGDGGLPNNRKQVCTCLALKSCYWEGKCQTGRPLQYFLNPLQNLCCS